MFFCFSITLAQGNLKAPAFLDPKIDTVAFINCSQETLDTVISYIRKNPKFVIDNDISCSVYVAFNIEKNFEFTIPTNDIIVNLVFRNKQSKKYEKEIKKYYEEEALSVLTNLYGIFIPNRINGEYYSTKFYLNIDFTKGEEKLQLDQTETKRFKADELSSQSVLKNKRLKEKGLEMLKNKEPLIAFIYFRTAFPSSKDNELLVLNGNICEALGDPENACEHWKIAAKFGNKLAEDLVKKCNN